MSAAGPLLVALPVVAVLLLTVATRPRSADPVAPLRLAVVRAVLLGGAYAVLVVEVLGAARALTRPAFAVAWLLLLVAAGTAAVLRRRSALPARPSATAPRPVPVGAALSGGGGRTPAPVLDGGQPGPAPTRAGALAVALDAWRTAGRGERLLAGTVAGLVLVELLVALLAEPNNFDSQTYHLPKVEHWVAQGDLDFWPTAIHRQVTIPPGAEYLLLHLRLFTGGDHLHNLVQWAAGVVCLLVAARITAQLGGGRRAQLLTAFLLATTPMVVLQATSTQTDLVCAAWVGCAATLVLDGLRRPTGWGTVLGLGAATGLTAVTKTSGLIAVGPLLVLWGVAQLRLALTARPTPGRPTDDADEDRRSGPVGGLARTVAGSVLILLVAAVVVGPFLARVTADFGHPLGPPRLRESIPMERHDPASIVVNALRIGHTAFDTPLEPLRRAGAEAIISGADAIGVDPQDRAITFGRELFPEPAWYPDEDRVAFPLTGALAVVGLVFALARPRQVEPDRAGSLRAYAGVVLVAVLLHTAMIKWQPWGNRLLLYAVVLAVPLAGLWLDALFRRRAGDAARGRRSVATLTAVAVLAGSALAGVLALSYGFPRRLVGTGSVFTTADWDTRFLRRPQWADEFRWAAAAVQASGARRIGLVQQNDNWEYPWWLLLRRPDGGSPDLVALQSVLPERPPADPSSVDAIVCTGSRPACAKLVPAGWRLEFDGYVGYALPPGR
ncbi:glycosyltransferase family 39 protein [Micromonospora sp. WMMD1120]|uniref:glycosyltransferase family 39 protein n=1 Tax=Micromonospora sp. WMMD1120 TaxID=3016106 RepID=UPI00241779DF|nr:glycosyltransferase family 39 protein [Micromonospora sp. WMMD1120]MDG4806792.1 glycosyltransferase family 39 protein [Micromonospora sp. WMMD1120]